MRFFSCPMKLPYSKNRLRQSKKSQEIKKKNLQMELEKNIRTNYSENIVIGQIFMAIDNLAFKCTDIDAVIKSFKNSKKGETNDLSRQNSLNDYITKVKGTTQKDMFDPIVTQENLEYILNTMNDLKEILKKKY